MTSRRLLCTALGKSFGRRDSWPGRTPEGSSCPVWRWPVLQYPALVRAREVRRSEHTFGPATGSGSTASASFQLSSCCGGSFRQNVWILSVGNQETSRFPIIATLLSRLYSRKQSLSVTDWLWLPLVPESSQTPEIHRLCRYECVEWSGVGVSLDWSNQDDARPPTQSQSGLWGTLDRFGPKVGTGRKKQASKQARQSETKIP